jgi:hypothetical protein
MKSPRTIPLPAWLPLLAGLQACVVPVSPEWTDPQGNVPPTLHSAAPAVGSVLVLDPDAGEPLAVQVVLADQNTRDNLYTRFIIDYPPWVDGVSRVALPTVLPGGNEVQRPALRFAPNCNDDHIARGFANHRLLLAFSDRPFVGDDPAQAAPDAVPAGNFLVEASWQFELDCQ